jgi:phage shock protein E
MMKKTVFQQWHRYGLMMLLLMAAALPVKAQSEPDLWIDVRTAEEFEQAHVAAAVNIPYDQIANRIGELSLNKDAEIYLYCRSGRRSGIALKALQALGYSRVVNIGGLAQAQAVELQ